MNNTDLCCAKMGWAALTLAAFFWATSAHAADADALRVQLSRDVVLLGSEEPTNVVIDLYLPAEAREADTDVIRLYTTAGNLSALQKAGPGHFRSTLTAPQEAYPQLAVVSAAWLHGSVPVVQSRAVAYRAFLSVPGRSEARSNIRVDVGGKVFGPFTADTTGAFTMDIVVPPGTGFATATATDVLGNTSRSRINLFLPDVVRFHTFFYPEAMVAGTNSGFVFVTTVSSTGQLERVELSARAERGTIDEPQAVAPGIVRMRYHAPTKVQQGEDTLTLASKSGIALEQAVPILAAAPARIVSTCTPQVIPADGQTRAELTVRVLDAYDNPVLGLTLGVEADKQALAVVETQPGVYQVVVPARAKMGSTQAVVLVKDAQPALSVQQSLQWRPPVPLSLVLKLIERGADAVTLKLLGPGAVDLRDRVRLAASAGSVRVEQAANDELQLVLTPAPKLGQFVDVVATDLQSGVATRLRVE